MTFFPIPLVILTIENENDRAFIQNLYIQYQKLMYHRAISILKSQGDAEDAIHTSIIALIDKIDVLRQMNAFTLRSYINSTVKNTSLNILNKRNRRYVHEESLEMPIAYDDKELMRMDDVMLVADALKQLSENDQLVLRLRYYEDKTDAEIGEILGIKPDSVRPRLMRARQSLYRALKEPKP